VYSSVLLELNACLLAGSRASHYYSLVTALNEFCHSYLYSRGTDMDLQQTHHVIAIQQVYWRVGRIYRKHSFLYCCVLDRVYRAVARQRVDQIRYSIFLYELGLYAEIRINVVFLLRNCLPPGVCFIKFSAALLSGLRRCHKVGVFVCVANTRRFNCILYM
jgi:hypothetical protein